ncbi:hypothetical protein AT852_08450 [Shigella sonnei]|uniref:Uncharacterized protein n=1 Tax=Shigella sonnei TaxID=624 RepID=A0AAU8VZ79_SHISO|nr:hypothetical protein B9127_08030 [Shigella sonnei]ARS04160.1 hypothetical protein BZ172_00885 [Shigella sonnei]ASN29338.1 hypothetical protein B9130_02985 [Shigella sonnei]ASN34279.1 hypothetical protein B9129_07480 [Shigella sonnei]ASN44967.1 hypothetical protein B9128_24265 [Shigella sonnei]
MRYPTREYQRDSPSDLLLRRPQGIKPKKKIVKIRDSGLTRKVISAKKKNRRHDVCRTCCGWLVNFR